jgi:hypothetical protein
MPILKTQTHPSRQWQTWLETLRTELARLPALAQAETSAAAQHDAAVETARRFEAVAATARQAEAETSRQLQHTDQALHIHGLAKPGFWARLFRTRAAHEWSDKLAVLRAHHRGAETQHSKTTAERCRIEEELRRARLKQQHAETAWQALPAHSISRRSNDSLRRSSSTGSFWRTLHSSRSSMASGTK